MQPGAQLDFWHTPSPLQGQDHDLYSVIQPNMKEGVLEGGFVGIKRPSYVSTLHGPFTQERFEQVQDREIQPGQQMKAFEDMHSRPGVVTSMFASPSHGAQTMTLLGAAALHHKARYGALPEASDDLSRYSSKIVQKAVDKGLVENPTSWDDRVEATNRETHLSPEEMHHSLLDMTVATGDRAKRMPDSMVSAGRSFVRGTFRTEKFKSRRSHFEQGRLF